MSAGGTGDGGALLQVCCAWCLVLVTCYALWTGQKTMRTRHATHPPAVPMVEGDAEGGGGGPRQRTNR